VFFFLEFCPLKALAFLFHWMDVNMVYIRLQGLGLTAASQVLYVPNTNRAGNQIYCDL